MTELMPAEGVFSLIWVLIALPLAGAAILLLGGRRTNSWGPYLAILTVAASAVIGVLMLLGMMQNSADQRTYGQTLFSWVFVGKFQADMAFQLDQLSICFVLLITIVGALILTVLTALLSSLGYPEAVRQILFGAIIVAVAAAYTRVTGET